jgi:hypothetical protein
MCRWVFGLILPLAACGRSEHPTLVDAANKLVTVDAAGEVVVAYEFRIPGTDFEPEVRLSCSCSGHTVEVEEPGRARLLIRTSLPASRKWVAGRAVIEGAGLPELSWTVVQKTGIGLTLAPAAVSRSTAEAVGRVSLGFALVAPDTAAFPDALYAVRASGERVSLVGRGVEKLAHGVFAGSLDFAFGEDDDVVSEVFIGNHRATLSMR